MDWYDAAGEYAKRAHPHGGSLSALPEEWQRELVALRRLQSDMWNGLYLQFLSNGGRESYLYASRALRQIGAVTMAAIIDRCQALVDEHFDSEGKSHDELAQLLPNRIIGTHGVVKEAGSVLPESVLRRVSELSYDFMDLPDDVGLLAQAYFGPLIAADRSAAPPGG